MNSLPPRYPSNTLLPSIVNLSDDKLTTKSETKISFRPSNGDFLQPPHQVFDKPKVSKKTADDNKDDKDSAAYEIAALKVEVAKAKTEARQHARVALYLRRENRRLQSEMETIRSNQIMFLEQKVGGGGICQANIACPHDSPTSTVLQHTGSFITVSDKAFSTSAHEQAIQTVLANICFLDFERGLGDNNDGNKSSTVVATDSSLIGEDLLVSDEESCSYSV